MYPFVFRTVFARMSAERAHHLVVPIIRMLGVWPFAPIVRAMTRPDPSLRTEAFGLVFDSPFGVAAGFDKNAVMTAGLYALGFGHVEVGTVTTVAQEGNPKPRLFRLVDDRALINRMGFNNAGAVAAAARLARARRAARGGRRAVLGANIGKSRIVDVEHATADYVTSTKLVAPVADYLVVNVSSPNTPGLRGLQAVETLRPLLEAVHAAAGSTPLLVKIAPDLPDDEVEAIARLAVEVGLSGLIATNTTISREGLRTDAATVAAIGAGGLSGAPLKQRSLAVLRLVRAVVPREFCVVAAGGVETAADVRERLAAGADLVQGYTAFIYRGPFWARQINRELVARA
ncbi:MAG: quinone-dependent dihydroorotate dehydrogenase [Microbacterium sp.]